jgi:nicotinamide-nucleotide amidase
MSERGKALAARVLRAAKDCGASLATAESCTGGAVAALLAEAPGAGEYLEGGVVAYTKDMKSKLLGVPKKLLAEQTAVAAEVAIAMAHGVLRRSPARIALAITGVAGPEPDEDGNPVGLMYCAVADRSGTAKSIRLMSRKRGRKAILNEGMCAALELLLAACRKAPARARR